MTQNAITHSVTRCTGPSSLGRRELAPLDVVYLVLPIELSVAFTLPGNLSIATLQRAVSRVLESYPELGGRYFKAAKDGDPGKDTIFLDLADCHLNIYECTVPALPQMHGRTPEALEAFRSHMVFVDQPILPPAEDDEDQGAVRIDSSKAPCALTLIHCESGGACILGISFNHALMDGVGLFMVLDAIAAECRSDESSPSPSMAIKPSNLEAGRVAMMREQQQQQQQQQLSASSAAAAKPAKLFIGFPAIQGQPEPCVWRTLDLPSERIAAIKQQLTAQSPDLFESRAPSTNDIVTAICWKLRAECTKASRDDDGAAAAPLGCTMCVNLRGPKRSPSHGEPLDKHYFGNAFASMVITDESGASPQQFSAAFVRRAPFAELVAIIRRNVDGMDRDRAEASIGLLGYRWTHEQGLRQCLRGQITPTINFEGYSTTSWAAFMDDVKLDFGTGDFVDVYVPTTAVFNVGFVLRPPPGLGGGVRMQIGVPVSFVEEFDRRAGGGEADFLGCAAAWMKQDAEAAAAEAAAAV